MIIEEISGHSPDRAAKVAKAMQAIETAEAAASLKRAGIEPGSLSMLDDAPASSRADNSGTPNPSATPTTADLKNLKPLDNGINNSAAALNAIIAKAQISIFEVIRTMSDNIFDSLGIKFNTGNAAAQRLDIDSIKKTVVDFANTNPDLFVKAVRDTAKSGDISSMRDMMRMIFPDMPENEFNTIVSAMGEAMKETTDIISAPETKQPPAADAGIENLAGDIQTVANEMKSNPPNTSSALIDTAKSIDNIQKKLAGIISTLPAGEGTATAATVPGSPHYHEEIALPLIMQQIPQQVSMSPVYAQIVGLKMNLVAPGLLDVAVDIKKIHDDSKHCRKNDKKMKENEADLMEMIAQSSKRIPTLKGFINLDDVIATITNTKLMISRYNELRPC